MNVPRAISVPGKVLPRSVLLSGGANHVGFASGVGAGDPRPRASRLVVGAKPTIKVRNTVLSLQAIIPLDVKVESNLPKLLGIMSTGPFCTPTNSTSPITLQPGRHFVAHTYKKMFFKQVHLNFTGKNEEGHEVISVLKKPENSFYHALRTTKKGSELFDIPEGLLEEGIKLSSLLESYLSKLFGYTITCVSQPEFASNLLEFEIGHSQNQACLKVAILYSDGKERALRDYFAHKKCSSHFWNFMGLLGDKIDILDCKKYRGDFGCPSTSQLSYYTEWFGIEVMYHVAPLMDKEQHRRIVGNDVIFVLFHESNKEFQVNPLAELGPIPQVFLVVQEVTGGRYRIGIITKSGFTEYDPPLSDLYSFAPNSVKDILLTKAYNGYCASKQCPPLNRLFEVPRAVALGDLAKSAKSEISINKRQLKKACKEFKGLGSQIKLQIIKARNLKTSATGHPDPYCIIQCCFGS